MQKIYIAYILKKKLCWSVFHSLSHRHTARWRDFNLVKPIFLVIIFKYFCTTYLGLVDPESRFEAHLRFPRCTAINIPSVIGQSNPIDLSLARLQRAELLMFRDHVYRMSRNRMSRKSCPLALQYKSVKIKVPQNNRYFGDSFIRVRNFNCGVW